MGLYVHIHVVFACDTNDNVAELAKCHLDKLTTNSKEAKWFLADLSQRTGCNLGTKGGLSLWGMIGNYTIGRDFVDALRPFWIELLKGEERFGEDWGGPLDFEHILVFEEAEESYMNVLEIYLDDDGELIIKEHNNMPFRANQY